jgi:hypothetical protein
MKVRAEFVGYVRKSFITSRALVRVSGFYYTWKGLTSLMVLAEQSGEVEVDTSELEVATDRQVVVGRNRDSVAGGSVSAIVYGVVQECKVHKRLLVKFGDCESFYTVQVPVGEDSTKGSVVSVNRRKAVLARTDQVDAGLGQGTLRRKRKKS